MSVSAPRMLRALLVYMVALSVPGMLGVPANSGIFILFQLACFFVLLFYAGLHLMRRWPNAAMPATEARFTWTYVGLLVVSSLAATALAIRDGDSFMSMAQFFLPAMLALVLMLGFGQVSVRRKDIDAFLGFILAFMVFGSLYNIVVNFHDIISLASITNSYDVDFKGFFYNRNIFGYMMAIGVACGLYLCTRQRKRIYLAALAILAISLFTAMSRGGIMFVAVFSLVFFLGRAKSKLLGIIAIASVCIPLVIFALNQPFIQDNLIRSDNADTGRSDLREFGANYFLHHNVLVGDGQNAITAIEEKYGHSSYHNLYIETLATQGLVGIAAVIVGIGYAFSRIRIIMKRYRDLGYFFLACLLAYIAYVLIEALPLFYATPNSLVTTYIIILLPMIAANSLVLQYKGEASAAEGIAKRKGTTA